MWVAIGDSDYTRVDLVKDGEVIASRTASGQPPTIDNVRATPHDDGGVTLTRDATGGDGDALVVPADQIMSPEHAVLRVRVSDGLHSARGQSGPAWGRG